MLSCFNEAVAKADELISLYGRCSPKSLARELDIEFSRIFQSRKAHVDTEKPVYLYKA